MRGSFRAIPTAGTIAAVLCAVVGQLHFFNLSFDDAFISFRYAENLVSGNGLVFNVGERVEGFSNFLWTLFLTVPAWLGAGRTDFGMLVRFQTKYAVRKDFGSVVLYERRTHSAPTAS